ncbi:aromatic ring-hydroxylating dioxygenase subunit alpha [Sphingomonas sp. SRS2]|uniref:aromatic ring-hydroxylating dioxygenase subunit alpha n=1 Tax=Sphingomonas sp. SRS2 TaxID=133190 RepID=UPI0006184772|nr:aromatic ring-hydroxylating dioxygenase subunit alpha [Sphingomonas sp. SRS2]KKC23930.1 hypothetical protein WP12_22125 [Sphingomonas sp. SRS2]
MYPLPEGYFAPRDRWYIAAWSSEIGREPIERWILDEPVALYRKENGEAVALDGRCPHRSFPLGKSRLVGDNIQCGYHGLTFRPDGSCTQIPSQPNIPNVCRVRSFPLVEQWKWLWIWMGDPDLADESMIPSLEELALEGSSYTIASGGYSLVNARAMLLHDNLFDLTHIGYLHAPSFGSGGGALDTVPRVTQGDDWIDTQYVQLGVPMPDFHARLTGYEGLVDRYQGLKLYLPGLHVGGSAFYRPTGIENQKGELIGSVQVYHGITPATRHSTNYFFATGQTMTKDPAVCQATLDYAMRSIIPEDAFATQEIEEMIERSGGRPSEILLKADRACVMGRRLFEKMIAAEHARAISKEGAISKAAE